MKKLIWILLLLLVPSLCFAWSPQQMHLQVIAQKNASTGPTNYLNDAAIVAAYYMNGNNDGELDRSGNGENLTEGGSVTDAGVNIPSGYSGSARWFQLADEADYLYHADGGSTDLSGADQEITIVSWIRLSSLSTDQSVVDKYNTVVNGRQYQFRFQSSTDDMYCGLSSDGATFSFADSESNLSNLTFYHVACVYDDSTITMYIDGEVSGTPTNYTSGIFNGNAQFQIGKSNISGSGRWYGGQIDETAIFSRALSQAEIQGIMNYGIDGTQGAND